LRRRLLERTFDRPAFSGLIEVLDVRSPASETIDR
jgi:hypothetical protein